MSNIHEQNCPLCGTQAKYELRNFHVAKHFLCGNCSEFIVTSEEVEKRLSEVPVTWLIHYSNMAKLSNQEQIFVIAGRPVSNNRKSILAIEDPHTGLRLRREWVR